MMRIDFTANDSQKKIWPRELAPDTPRCDNRLKHKSQREGCMTETTAILNVRIPRYNAMEDRVGSGTTS